MIQRFCKSIFIGLLAMLLIAPWTADADPAGSPNVFHTGFLSQPSKHTPAWIAYTYLAKNKKQLGIRYPRTDMIVTEVDSDDHERRYVYMQRLLFQTPVWGDRLVIEIDEDGVIRQVSGTVHPDLEKRLFHRPIRPAISAGKAAAIANLWLQSQKLPDSPAGEAQLWYIPDTTGMRLIYLMSTKQGNEVFVHALTGRVIKLNI